MLSYWPRCAGPWVPLTLNAFSARELRGDSCLKTDHIDLCLRIARKMHAEKLTPGIQRVNQNRASWTFKTSQVSTHPRLRATLESAGPLRACGVHGAALYRIMVLGLSLESFAIGDQHNLSGKTGDEQKKEARNWCLNWIELAHHCTPWHTMISASRNFLWFHHQHYRMVPPSYKLVYKPIN